MTDENTGDNTSEVDERARRYLEVLYFEALDPYMDLCNKLPFFRQAKGRIDLVHQPAKLFGNDVDYNAAAKVLVPEHYHKTQYKNATAAEEILVTQWAEEHPGYKRAVEDYAEWLDIFEDVYSLAITIHAQQGRMLQHEIDHDRETLINRIVNLQGNIDPKPPTHGDGEWARDTKKAEGVLAALEKYAETCIKNARLDIDQEYLGDAQHVSRWASKSATFRVGSANFMDKALTAENSFYDGTRRGLESRVRAYNKPLVKGEDRFLITSTDVLTVMSAYEHQRSGIPIMWDSYVGPGTWKDVDKFLKSDTLAATQAKSMVHMRHAYEELFNIAYKHREDEFPDEVGKEADACVVELCKQCPEIRGTSARSEMLHAIPLAEKAILETKAFGRGFDKAV